jgi:uncharacterized membrane protein YhaH (DUF805 family)
MTTPEAQAGRINRLRNWVVALVFVIIFAGSIGPLTIITYFNRLSTSTQLELSCQTLKNQDNQLRALRSFSLELGVPWVYPIPEVPPECDGS